MKNRYWAVIIFALSMSAGARCDDGGSGCAPPSDCRGCDESCGANRCSNCGEGENVYLCAGASYSLWTCGTAEEGQAYCEANGSFVDDVQYCAGGVAAPLPPAEAQPSSHPGTEPSASEPRG